MGIIAWIILGLVAGWIAKMLIPGKDREGIIITTLLGVAGALLGGFVASRVFDVDAVKGFFNISTWITAIIGAAVLLLIYHMATGWRSGRRMAGRR
jgi:uncharacterized membrane protein YeaQ/YmgE (transglycosylase-associated protein family)